MVQLETIGHFDILEGYNTYKFRYDSVRHNTQGTSKFNISNISIGGIINGEKYTGVTLHYLNENFDDGNIIFQEMSSLNPSLNAH